MRYSFSKTEKLTKKEHFDALYERGRSVKAFPFSLRYLPMDLEEEGVHRKVAVVVPKRGLKLAVDRNRVKRQMRELYRLHKHEVFESGQEEIWSIRYLGNRLNDYAFLESGFQNLLKAYHDKRKEELDSEGSK